MATLKSKFLILVEVRTTNPSCVRARPRGANLVEHLVDDPANISCYLPINPVRAWETETPDSVGTGAGAREARRGKKWTKTI